VRSKKVAGRRSLGLFAFALQPRDLRPATTTRDMPNAIHGSCAGTTFSTSAHVPLECRSIQHMERGESERIEITISSRFENIELVQVIAEHLCENAGLDEDGSHWIGMAVREAVANAIKHGNKLDVGKKVHARFDLRGADLEITISDEGEGFDPDTVGDPLNPQNLMKTSGRGIFYMKTFMDAIRYSFNPESGTSLLMTKNLAKGPGIASSKA
jgi:serine/threonine-protein kinase RsbW